MPFITLSAHFVPFVAEDFKLYVFQSSNDSAQQTKGSLVI